MFQWGNHRYYHVFENEVVEFASGHHELRPIIPGWDLFWKRVSERTARYIRTMARRCLYDSETGGFKTAARELAEEAVNSLCEKGMFRGYAGHDFYEAFNGVGWLLLAFVLLEGGTNSDLKGLSFWPSACCIQEFWATGKGSPKS